VRENYIPSDTLWELYSRKVFPAEGKTSRRIQCELEIFVAAHLPPTSHSIMVSTSHEMFSSVFAKLEYIYLQLPGGTIGSALFLSLSLYLSVWSLVYLYRITLHPLAHIPGPKLAAATYWYECYYDVWPLQAQFLWRIQEMHEKYG
jgi:hypothetical protein